MDMHLLCGFRLSTAVANKGAQSFQQLCFTFFIIFFQNADGRVQKVSAHGRISQILQKIGHGQIPAITDAGLRRITESEQALLVGYG